MELFIRLKERNIRKIKSECLSSAFEPNCVVFERNVLKPSSNKYQNQKNDDFNFPLAFNFDFAELNE